MQAHSDAYPPVVRGLFRFFYKPADKAVSVVEAVLLFICSAAIMLAMGLTTLDVILRYGFSNPMSGTFDFVMLYLMPAAYYLAFSHGMKSGAHLSVDFFVSYFPRIFMRTVLPFLFLVAVGAGTTGAGAGASSAAAGLFIASFSSAAFFLVAVIA